MVQKEHETSADNESYPRGRIYHSRKKELDPGIILIDFDNPPEGITLIGKPFPAGWLAVNIGLDSPPKRKRNGST